MITPAQLKAYEFKQSGRNAYKADDVDEFLAQISVDYEKMFRENSDLIRRINLLADKLEEYKNDESDIKEAVMSAQKAAKLIIQDAENSVFDSKAEAEAILAAAKGEADIIKADAERQAIADAELALSVAKDKAEEIIAKAKEKAHGILIAANDSASDTVGAANRTITSESLHYDMLKKEVSEFRASVLAQYKAHIELISKLPELAVEEASKKEEQIQFPEKSVDEIEESVDNTFNEAENKVDDLMYVSNQNLSEEFEEIGETVVKTELPYDFYNNDSTLEYINDEEDEDDSVNEASVDEAKENDSPADIPISKKFSVNILNDSEDEFFENDDIAAEAVEEETQSTDTADEIEAPQNDEDEKIDDEPQPQDDEFGYEDDEEDDYGFMTSNFFDNVEKVSTEDDGNKEAEKEEKISKGFKFFKRKK